MDAEEVIAGLHRVSRGTANWDLDAATDAEVVIEAAISLLEAERWRPIEEAEEDGGLVDLWISDNAGGYRLPSCYLVEKGWMAPVGGHYKLLPDYIHPAHFRPLPQPPKETT